MKVRTVLVAAAGLSLLATPVGAKGRTEQGGSQAFGNVSVTASAVLNGDGTPREVEVDIPMAVIQTPPPVPGPGPAEAVAVIPFPPDIQKTTYLNHFEMHWNPHGHIPPIFMKPHFDFHFYGIPVDEVRAIKEMDPTPPAPEYMPKGYIYFGKDTFIPEMGVHTGSMAVMDMPFTADMIAGIANGRMNFFEPMVTQDFLLQKKTFRLDMPLPQKFGRDTLYPMKFEGKYDRKSDAFRLILTDFKPVH